MSPSVNPALVTGEERWAQVDTDVSHGAEQAEMEPPQIQEACGTQDCQRARQVSFSEVEEALNYWACRQSSGSPLSHYLEL